MPPYLSPEGQDAVVDAMNRALRNAAETGPLGDLRSPIERELDEQRAAIAREVAAGMAPERARKLVEYGPGPWVDEPDRVAFESDDGFGRLIRRTDMGTLCGYLILPDEHEWSGRHKELIPVETHGGLTFAEPVSHLQGECDRDRRFAMGFDTTHFFDVWPMMARRYPEIFKSDGVSDLFTPQYRDLEYVKAAIEALAQQARTPVWITYWALAQTSTSRRKRRQIRMFALLHKRIANRRLPDQRDLRQMNRRIGRRRAREGKTA
jgi:hypothetical protein